MSTQVWLLALAQPQPGGGGRCHIPAEARKKSVFFLQINQAQVLFFYLSPKGQQVPCEGLSWGRGCASSAAAPLGLLGPSMFTSKAPFPVKLF